MSLRSIGELAGFQAVWLVCALGAAQGWSAPGVVAGCLFVAAQLSVHGAQRAVIATTFASGLLGLAMETLAMTAGLVGYSAHWPHASLAPAWIVVLWLAFGSTIPTFATLLGARPLLAAAMLGALFGPLAYAAGAKLGALQIAQPAWIAYTMIACAWGIALPALVGLARAAAERKPGLAS